MMKKILLPLVLFGFVHTTTVYATDNSPEYDACMDTAYSTVDMLACTDAEVKKHDKLLNANYRKLMSNLNPDRQATLRKAQRLWIKYRQANCDFYYDPEGGTIQSLHSSGCVLTMTADRAKELGSLLANTKE